MKKFTSVDELFADIEKNKSLWDKIITHPSMNWLRWIIYNLKDVPNDLYRKCKRGLQRVYWGLADEDIWGLDFYLSKVILRGLKKLREDKQGCPILDGYGMYDDDKEFEEMYKEWKSILDTMIWTFEVTIKIQSSDWLMLPEKGFTEKEMAHLSENFHVMTVEEMEKYNEGWKNFTRYYFSLWN